MKPLLQLLFALFVVSFFTTSCVKTKIEEKIIRDTLLTPSKDTNFVMSVNSWNLFSYSTFTLAAPGSTTYINTSEGIKFFGTGYRSGARLQTKTEVAFTNKTIYYKWKGNGSGSFAGVVPQIKYDHLSNDATPSIQGVDLALYSFNNSFSNSTLVQNDTWYYTTAKAVANSDNYLVTTCITNYSNNGGTIIHSLTLPVYTKHGYIAIRLGDNYGGTAAFVVVGECKIGN